MTTGRRAIPVVLVALGLAVLAGAPAARAADEIGIYFDPAYEENFAVAETAFTTVTGHLVIRRDDGAGGVLAWECRVALDGPGVFTGWQLEGQAINARSAPEFAVGLASPLPPTAAVRVASFDLLVTEVPVPVDLSLVPIHTASLPDAMAFISGDDPETLRPLTTVTGEPWVAAVNGNTGTWCGTDWVHVIYFGEVEAGVPVTRQFYVESCGGSRHLDIQLICDTGQNVELTGLSGPVVVPNNGFVLIDVTWTPQVPGEVPGCILDIGDEAFPIFGYAVDPVAVVAPTPLALVGEDGVVELSWPAVGGDGATYHVYRRAPDTAEVRLTEQPLAPVGSLVRYTDRPGPTVGGALDYSYAIVTDGREWARSAAASVQVDGPPRLATQLLPNVPNPFNPSTRIDFTLARRGHVRVAVYDLTGRRVATLVDGERDAGPQDVVWTGRDDAGRQVASGAYAVRLETTGQIDQRTILMLK
ncbi:hypothetical protein KDM41_05025 [bacterium]|nr:hypothetical protein [bacterium]